MHYLYKLQDAICRMMTFILMDAGLVEYYSCWISMNVVLKKGKMEEMSASSHLNSLTQVKSVYYVKSNGLK